MLRQENGEVEARLSIQWHPVGEVRLKGKRREAGKFVQNGAHIPGRSHSVELSSLVCRFLRAPRSPRCAESACVIWEKELEPWSVLTAGFLGSRAGSKFILCMDLLCSTVTAAPSNPLFTSRETSERGVQRSPYCLLAATCQLLQWLLRSLPGFLLRHSHGSQPS